MRYVAMSLLLVLLGFNGYSQSSTDAEDTTVTAVVDFPAKQVIITTNSDQKIDSIELTKPMGKLPYYKAKVDENNIADMGNVPLGSYYITFITETRKRLLQKLYFQ